MIPFEGLFGDTSELKLIDFLLPSSGVQYSIAELVTETELSRPVVTNTVKKFSEWEILKVVKHGKRNLYQLSDDSPFVKLFRDINGKIIERTLGENAVHRLREYQQYQQQRDASTNSSARWYSPPTWRWRASTDFWEGFVTALGSPDKEPENAESFNYVKLEPGRRLRTPLAVISAD